MGYARLFTEGARKATRGFEAECDQCHKTKKVSVETFPLFLDKLKELGWKVTPGWAWRFFCTRCK